MASRLFFRSQSTSTRESSDNIVMSSLSEIVLFLLFFFLILMGEKTALDLDTSTRGDDTIVENECLKKMLACQRINGASNICARRADQCLSNISEWPPVITLSDAEGFTFKQGSSALTTDFRNGLTKEVIPTLVSLVKDERRTVSAIEIIGHTDEKPFVHEGVKPGDWGNLDHKAIETLDGRFPASRLEADDNAGLGLARALSVREFLRNFPELKDVPILVFSASYTVEDGTQLATGTLDYSRFAFLRGSRRRIEIRVRGPLKEMR